MTSSSSSLTRAGRLLAAAAAASACALLTACGTTPAPGAAGPTRTVTVQAGASGGTSSSAATSPAAQTGPAGCLASGLQANLGVSQGTAGTIYQVIVLTNTSSATCTLYGYPGVSFVTGIGGSQIGKPATKNPVVARSLVTLAPGAKADVLMAVHDAGAFPGCRIVTVHWLRIYPPGDYGSVYVQYQTQACRLRSIMSVTAVRVGAGSASY